MNDFSKILESVKETNLAANKERLISPELIQKTRALRASAGTEIHHAFCKADAPASDQITCFLDTDTTGEEITVHCNISNGSALNAASRRLVIGDRICVVLIAAEWICLEGFQASEDCVCTEP